MLRKSDAGAEIRLPKQRRAGVDVGDLLAGAKKTNKGMVHKGIFLGSRIVKKRDKNHRKSIVESGRAAGNRR